jgi:hypothetical protein
VPGDRQRDTSQAARVEAGAIDELLEHEGVLPLLDDLVHRVPKLG